MREIKFRAFDKKNKRLFQCEYLGLNDKNALADIGRDATDFELMQFTGLLDKNGKEIYEGDIVTCHTTTFNYPHKGQVIYLQHGCGFGITTEPIVNERTGLEEEAFTYFNYNEDFEIIGNIYQHPELIEEA